MHDLIGRVMGTYQILDLVGRGGMAEVYKAYDRTLRRYVAIKVLKDELARDPKASSRFLSEAQRMARLNHKNIVPIYAYDVYAYDERDELSYFVMPLIEGGTLQSLMRGPVEFKQAVSLIEPLASALGEAHNKGIVHRDVKPANVLMPERDFPLLSDFGIARALEGSTVASSMTFIGTPQYMAPEQVLGREVSGKTDQYALAVVLYEMLAGRPPFQGESSVAVALQHAHSSPPSPRSVNPDVPEPIEDVIMRALEKEPDRRFADMASFVTAVRAAAMPTQGIAGPSAGSPRTTGGRWVDRFKPPGVERLMRWGSSRSGGRERVVRSKPPPGFEILTFHLPIQAWIAGEGFQFGVPDGWAEWPPERRMAFSSRIQQPTLAGVDVVGLTDDAFCWVAVNTLDQAMAADFEQLLRAPADQREQAGAVLAAEYRARGVQLLAPPRPVLIDSERAVLLLAQYFDDSEKQAQLMTTHRRRGYMVSCGGSPPKVFDRYLSDFFSILATWRWTQG